MFINVKDNIGVHFVQLIGNPVHARDVRIYTHLIKFWQTGIRGARADKRTEGGIWIAALDRDVPRSLPVKIVNLIIYNVHGNWIWIWNYAHIS